MAREYATAADVAAYPGGDTVDAADVPALIRHASRLVDQLLVGRVYDVDTDGYPTDADDTAALADATCAIVVELDATGAMTPGATQEWDAVGIGSVSFSGRKTTAGATEVAGVTIPAAALLALADVGTLVVYVR